MKRTPVTNFAYLALGFLLLTSCHDTDKNPRLDLVKDEQAMPARKEPRVLPPLKEGHGLSKLRVAVRAGDLEGVKSLIKDGADPNEIGPDGKAALHTASRLGHPEIVSRLIEAGAQVDLLDSSRTSAISYASSNTTIVEILIKAGAKVDSMAFSQLAMSAPPQLLRELIKNGANVNPPEDTGPLLWACFSGRSETAALLLAEGALTNPQPADPRFPDESPLHVVASRSFMDMNSPKGVTPKVRLKIAEQLLAKGADVNAEAGVGHFDGWTALMGASKSGHLEMTKLLLKKGANVNFASPGGMRPGLTALHFASAEGHAEVVKTLLERKATVNATTGTADLESLSKKTPLDLAKDEKVRELLIQHGGKTAAALTANH